MSVNVVFECKKPDGTLLNAVKFSSKLAPGYCLGMSADWAKTVLTFGTVKGLDALHPGKWAIVQSAYEQAARLGGRGPDAISAIEGEGMEVTNFEGDQKGVEIFFGESFRLLSHSLAGLVGTYIIYLGGGPGGGGHFMGFRRLGDGNFILGEWFDPNDCLMEVTAQADWRPYIEGMLAHSYAGKGVCPDLRKYCCIAKVEKQAHPSVAVKPQERIGSTQFSAIKNAFERGVAFN